MKLKEILIDNGGSVTYNTNPAPSSDWLDDDHIRWLNVEGGTRNEIAELFNNLGTKGEFIADHIRGDNWLDWVEESDFFIKANAAPTAWYEHEKWYHLVVLPETVITIHAAETPEIDTFIQKWWLNRPAPDVRVDDVLMQVVKTFVAEEVTFFNKFRLGIERHAEGLRLGNETFTVEQLEALMTQCHHMTTVYYEYQVLLQSLEHNMSAPFSAKSFSEAYRSAAKVIGTLRDGVEYVQRRLEELQRQYVMDQQIQTEHRLRTLTIVSVIFMPLTLISSIYGMNFDNMPELHGQHAYFMVLGSMGLVAIGLLGFFLAKGWFR